MHLVEANISPKYLQEKLREITVREEKKLDPIQENRQ